MLESHVVLLSPVQHLAFVGRSGTGKTTLVTALIPRLVAAGLAVGSIILVESALSFLGFGVPPPAPSWGELLGQARASPSAWWLALPPGLCIFLVVSACNVLGEGLRHALGAAGQTLSDPAS